jgi:hypothetical protein
MRKHYRLLAAAAAITSVAVTGVTAASAASAAPQTGGSAEYIQIMSASANGGPASAIARGAFTAAGEAHFGNGPIATIVFAGGTITLRHKASHGSGQIDPRTCLNVITQSGTYQLTSGTGRYAGIRCSGTYQLSLEFIAARAHGRCTTAKAPVAQQELLRLAGQVRL